MQKRDPSIQERLAEEIYHSPYTFSELARTLGCVPATISGWLSGATTPYAHYLAKLYRAGFDVIYILTGERTRNDQARSKDNR